MANSGNGGIIGVSNVVQNGCTASGSASGVWQLNTVYDYVKDSDWVYNFAALDYLVLAGGGASANSSSGGAGAGGLLSSYPGGTKVDIREGGVTTVTVGAGAAIDCLGRNGDDSTLATVTSTGGGYGGGCHHIPAPTRGPGGSGGGGSNGGGGTGIPGQGNPGGSFGGSSAGGGGGAGAAGTNAPGYPGGGGPGGNGLANTIAPAYPLGTTYGGGGGGHGQPGTGGTAGSGGGGAGSGDPQGPGTGTVGVDGLGGGGGGGEPGDSRTGGDGVIFVRMPTACKPAAYAVAPGTNTVATVGCCTVATFTIVGTLTL